MCWTRPAVEREGAGALWPLARGHTQKSDVRSPNRTRYRACSVPNRKKNSGLELRHSRWPLAANTMTPVASRGVCMWHARVRMRTGKAVWRGVG